MVIFPGQQVAIACAREQTRLGICSLECWLVLDIDSIGPLSTWFQLLCSQNRVVSTSVSCTLHASSTLVLFKGLLLFGVCQIEVLNMCTCIYHVSDLQYTLFDSCNVKWLAFASRNNSKCYT